MLEGHLWVFSNEIEKAEPASPGALVDIYSNQKRFLGRGFYNPHSLIAARILTYNDEKIDQKFLAERVKNAALCREEIYPKESSYRLIFGESDFLPGLIVDRYGETFVIQSNALGMDLLFDSVLAALKEIFTVRCVVKKNNSSLRSLENLPEELKVVEGEITEPVSITQKFGEKEIKFFVDPLRGQKTGFFFDQKENRERLKDYSEGRTVLDCFSYSGGFGLYAALSGAKEVISIDSSESACKLLQENFQQNGARCLTLQKDVFEALSEFQKEKRKFDIIVLDPPALAKSKKNIFGAVRKYCKLNETALSLLNGGGVLFSSSCSHHVSKSDFIQMLKNGSLDAGKRVKLLEFRGQSRDHPVLLSMPETDYLKCAILRVE